MWGFREDTREDNNRQNQSREFSAHFVLLANFASIFASTVQSTQYTVQRTAYSAVQHSTFTYNVTSCGKLTDQANYPPETPHTNRTEQTVTDTLR